MKLLIFTIVSVISMAALIEAIPQRVYYQKLPYYPPPTARPRLIRARRAVLGRQVSTNPAGGNNAKLDLTHGFGTPDHNVSTQGGPVATGGTLAYKK